MRTCGRNIHEEGTGVASFVNDLKAFFCTLEVGVIRSADVKSISDVEYRTAGHPTDRMLSAALRIRNPVRGLTVACVHENAQGHLRDVAGKCGLP